MNRTVLVAKSTLIVSFFDVNCFFFLKYILEQEVTRDWWERRTRRMIVISRVQTTYCCPTLFVDIKACSEIIRQQYLTTPTTSRKTNISACHSLYIPVRFMYGIKHHVLLLGANVLTFSFSYRLGKEGVGFRSHFPNVVCYQIHSH